VVAGHSPTFASFAGWEKHPPFGKRWAGAPQDPGTIRFPHNVHLDPAGVALVDQKQLDEQWEGGPAKPGEVKTQVLTCADCHQPDEAGQFMKPIRYEQHCQQCHPLNVQLAEVPADREARAAARRFAGQPVPHREPLLVRGVLRERLFDLIGEPASAALLAALPEEQPLRHFRQPDRLLEMTGPLAWVERQQDRIEFDLFFRGGGCRYCHQMTTLESTAGPGLPAYAVSGINQRSFAGLSEESNQWFPHARFQHDSHRMVKCAECHDAPHSTTSRDVLMPTIETCRKCHTASGTGSARTGCVECHTYHPHAEQRRFRGEKSIEEILSSVR
jgi:hypothetical protein